jgi:hypothetical protein
MKALNKYPMVKLNDGLTIVNFSSPHKYIFDSGEVLNACEDHVAEAIKLNKNHAGVAHIILQDNKVENIAVPDNDTWKEYINDGWPDLNIKHIWLDVHIDFTMSDVIKQDILMLAELDIINIILVPYPVMEAWKQEAELVYDVGTVIDEGVLVDDPWQQGIDKMRTCHFYDRITKTIHHNRFCK